VKGLPLPEREGEKKKDGEESSKRKGGGGRKALADLTRGALKKKMRKRGGAYLPESTDSNWKKKGRKGLAPRIKWFGGGRTAH